MITARQLAIGYDSSRLYGGLNVALQQGALTCLLGPNGAGKSTLLRTLCGLQRPLSGLVEVDGVPLGRISPNRRSRLIGLVLADRGQVASLTVRELVELGRFPYTGFFGRLSETDHRKVAEAMALTGVSAFAGRRLSQLSDGERQKAMIARALAQESPCLILDEPTAFLDLNARVEIMDLLHRLAVDCQKSILLSTHDMDTAFQYADEFWLLSPSLGFKQGFPEDLICTGEFAAFFAHADIAFDISDGQFRRNNPAAPSLRIDAPDEWRKWLLNIIYRCGYRFDSTAESLICMESIRDITYISSKSGKYICQSLKELTDVLKEMNKKMQKNSSKSL